MSIRSLEDWLAHLERLHPKTIELGLDRVRVVQKHLNLFPQFPIITVAGTNGKGSTCAMLEACLLAAGYRVGLYSSPHLIRYNERVRIDGRMLDDAELCAGFAAVDAGRGDTALTYFEFGTLAAMWSFMQNRLDVVILEVGLGGRLDAVNIFEPEVAVVTAIDLDHQEYLGHTREVIGLEKAGIFRANKPAVCADPEIPASVITHAHDIGANLLCLDRDFGAVPEENGWTYWGPQGRRRALPLPSLRGVHQLQNAAAALTALERLQQRLPLSQAHLRSGLLSARVPGRFQVLVSKPLVVLDVAHNPHAAQSLAENLRAQPVAGKTYAVFGMLRDKDIDAVIASVKSIIDVWVVGSLGGERGTSAEQLIQCLHAAGVTEVHAEPDIAQAYAFACRQAGENDRICAFGSFHTVAEVLLAQGAKT